MFMDEHRSEASFFHPGAHVSAGAVGSDPLIGIELLPVEGLGVDQDVGLEDEIPFDMSDASFLSLSFRCFLLLCRSFPADRQTRDVGDGN
jgi:hypothetical protein